MFQKLLEIIGTALRKRKIPYIIIGGQALLVYGEPRLTKDIDITLGLGPEQFAQIQALVKELGWKILTESPEAFVKQTMVLPCQEPESGIRIDFIFSSSLYEQEAIQRAKKILIGKTEVFFASLEDFIIHKIIAGRPRDLEDVRTVLVKNPNPDISYIQKCLKEFEQLLAQSFLTKFNAIRKNL